MAEPSVPAPEPERRTCFVPQMCTHWAGVVAHESPCRESKKHQKEEDDAKKDEARPAMMAYMMIKFGWPRRRNLDGSICFIDQKQTYGWLCTRLDQEILRKGRCKGFGHMVSDQLLNKIVHYIVRFGWLMTPEWPNTTTMAVWTVVYKSNTYGL